MTDINITCPLTTVTAVAILDLTVIVNTTDIIDVPYAMVNTDILEIVVASSCADVIDVPTANINNIEILLPTINSNNVDIDIIEGFALAEVLGMSSVATNKSDIKLEDTLNVSTECLSVIVEVSTPSYQISNELSSYVSGSTGESIEVTFATTKPNITDYGICWAEHINPTINDNYESYGIPISSPFVVSAELMLLSSTVYYARVYVVSDNEIIYDSQNFLFGSYLEVSTPEDLFNVRYNLFANYVQTADIDLSGYSNWLPIGYDINGDDIGEGCFQGVYDGQGFKISNLNVYYLNSSILGVYNFGLFASIGSDSFIRLPEVKNVFIENARINGLWDTGVLAGSCWGKLTNCHVNNSEVYGASEVGILVGATYENQEVQTSFEHHMSDIINCSVENSIVGISENDFGHNLIGGFAGFLGNMLTENCYVKNCTFIPNEDDNSEEMGGFAGRIYGGNIGDSNQQPVHIKKCWTDMNISGYAKVGGFAGKIYPNTCFENCYALGNIDAVANYFTTAIRGCYAIGGFAGDGTVHEDWYSDGYGIKFINCYSIGRVSVNVIDYSAGTAGTNYTTYFNHVIGGFIGLGEDRFTQRTGGEWHYAPIINNCYYDSYTSGYSDNIGSPRTTAEMKTQSTFNNWDFVTIWQIVPTINSGYPSFRGVVVLPITRKCVSKKFPFLMGNQTLLAFRW